MEVYDLSHTLGNHFRDAYCGGIVEVYRPHLIGEGYYCDVNSLYPTAMCNSMPVGVSTRVSMTPAHFQSDFFGFLRATVRAPDHEYIGLLPIKHNGRLICPGKWVSVNKYWRGLVFPETPSLRRSSLEKGRGQNTFLDLIIKLNQIKVDAQNSGKPVLRSIAKLLPNSMYGRFGMHTPPIKYAIMDHNGMSQLMKQYSRL